MLYYQPIILALSLGFHVSAQSSTTTANYDAIPTGAIKNPYKGLTYSNMIVSDASSNDGTFLRPASGKHYVESTNQYDFSLTSNSYFFLDSVSFGCTGCIGSGCAGGTQPIACNVTAVSSFSAGTATTSYLLRYSPPAHQQGTPAAMQKITLPDSQLAGDVVHFSLQAGQGLTHVFFDNLVYHFQ